MILAIDPASKTGWAYCLGGRQWRCGTCLGRVQELRAAVIAAAVAAGCTHVICEDAFLGPNASTFKMLVELRKDWEAESKAAGLAVIPAVLATVWQASMLSIGGRNCPKGETKEASLKIAGFLGAHPKNDHEADAVCLAEYARCVGAG